MSTDSGEEIFTIGARLRKERERIGLSQEAFGKKIGTSGRTIKKYEGNETSPRAEELLVASTLGVDVLYVVAGVHTPIQAMQDRAIYTPAENLAAEIAGMKLSSDDAEMLKALAVRLSKEESGK